MGMRDKSAIVGLLLFVCASIVPLGGARAAVPPSIAAELQRVASEIQFLFQNEIALANGMTDPTMADILVSRAGDRAGDAISAAVVGAIARSPADQAEIIALAGAMAPMFRDRIASDVARAFPGFATGYRPVVITYPTTVYDQTTNYSLATTYTVQTAFNYTPPPPAPASLSGDPLDVYFDDADAMDEIYDPLESFNRFIFWFNDQLDSLNFKPIARVYGFVTPDVAKQAIARGFDNLGAPARFANDLLQGEFADAGTTGARFLINSSIGIAGLIDVAEIFGHEAQPADFGQTLYVYGVGPGPYLILPILGPTTLRDGFGQIVDSAFVPFNYMFNTVPVNLSLAGAEGLVKREEFLEPLDDLRANSIDYYSALRGAFFQDRNVDLQRDAEAPSAMFDDTFAAFE
jgi:phospholipid-binding lipoprotein MlaA